MMWLLKLKSLQQRNKQLNNGKPIVISKLTITAIPLLLSVIWYPRVNALLHENDALKKNLEGNQKEQAYVQSEINHEQILPWLNDYQWLTWRLDEGLINGVGQTQERVVELSLQGITSYEQWQKIINRLLDTSNFQPVKTLISWQIDGQFNASLILQLASKSFDLPLFVIPKRIKTAWPKEMAVSTALYWDDEWRAHLSIPDKTVYLREGLWLPELAATLIKIDAKSATFRKQYTSYEQNDLGLINSSESLIERTVYYAFAIEEKGSAKQ